MKKIFKIVGTFSILCFSFFYTDKVVTVISDNDPLKQEIINVSENYKVLPNEAVVKNDEIIPGSNGRVVNIEKTYKKMRRDNIFNNNYVIYDSIYPKYRLIDNKDKYIVSGNINNNNVSILLLVNNNYYLNDIIKEFNKRNKNVNLFVSYEFLNNNISYLKGIKHNIYMYSDNYTYDTLLISNNIIKRISSTNPIYCLMLDKNTLGIKVCSYVDMYSVIPSIKGGYSDIKNNLKNGSIILLNNNYSTMKEISNIIDFISSKGYNIVSLDRLLSEDVL